MSIKWGVMGTANIAGKIVHTIGRAEGCEVVAVASRNLARYIFVPLPQIFPLANELRLGVARHALYCFPMHPRARRRIRCLVI